MDLLKFAALLSVFLLSSTVYAQEACLATVSQQLREQLTDGDGNIQSLYDCLVHNAGATAITYATLTTSSTFVQIWELQLDGDQYTLPAWRSTSGVEPNADHQFGYIIQGTDPASFAVTSCGSDSARVQAADATSAQAADAASAQAAATTRPSTTKAPAGTTTKAPTTTTKAPTTQAPTTKAPTTQAPTTKAPTTQAPTTRAPTTQAPGTNGRICPSGTHWVPAPGTTWQWQLTGTIDTTLNVQMFDIDLFDATASTISTLHAAGRVVICYFSTQYENWRPDAANFPDSVLGNPLDDWVGERYVDYRSAAVRTIMQARLDLAASKGCDGVEPDNVDSYSATTGFPLKASDQIDYNTFIADNAHSRGLSVGLKNDLDQAGTLQPYFDWALNEQCYQYGECADLKPFTDANKAVFNCEYKGVGGDVCPYMNGIKFSSLIKDKNLGASINAQCCTYLTSGCAKATYTCVASARKRTIAENVIGKTRIGITRRGTAAVSEQSSSASPLATCSVFALALLIFLPLFI